MHVSQAIYMYFVSKFLLAVTEENKVCQHALFSLV